MARVLAVCLSEKKGTVKEAVGQGQVRENFGFVGDAHADSKTHRQVSLLAVESIDKMRARGFELNYGSFAENITTEGLDLVSLPVGTRLSIGTEVLLEISQIGKECHKGCAIREQIGDCVMPREGVFARVIRGGPVKDGDPVLVRRMGGEPEA